MWNSEHHRMIPKYDNIKSLIPLVKHQFVTIYEYNNLLKITCQCYNSFLTRKGRARELFYITFLYAGFSTLAIYPEDIYPEIF